ncbi:Zinc finger protein [Armadillidium vulgare]|nr:Zinc finger protein [Armadillidium vulgare]
MEIPRNMILKASIILWNQNVKTEDLSEVNENTEPQDTDEENYTESHLTEELDIKNVILPDVLPFLDEPKANDVLQHKEKNYSCCECYKKFSTMIILRNHLKWHQGIKPFKCTLCHYRACKNCDVKAHMRIHTGEKPFKCKFCDHRSASNSAMKTHEMQHTGDLDIHKRKHTGETPYQCSCCDKKYKYKHSLVEHMKCHT